MYKILRKHGKDFEKELIDEKIHVEKKKLGNAIEKTSIETIDV
jgi:hypothetical protein